MPRSSEAKTRPAAGPAERPRGQIGSVSLTCLPVVVLFGMHPALASDSPGSALVSAPITYGLGALGPVDPINLTFHAGNLEFSRSITVSNIAPAGLSEGLNIIPSGFRDNTGTNGSFITKVYGTGSITNLAAGASDSTSLQLNVATMNRPGHYSIDMVLRPASNGAGTSGNGLTHLPEQYVTLTGTVIPFALPVLSASTVDFGAIRIGTTNVAKGLAITNGATDVAKADLLVAKVVASDSAAKSEIGATGGFGKIGGGTASGALAPGMTNTTGIQVTVDASTAGHKQGTVAVDLFSDGTPSGNGLYRAAPGIVGAADSGTPHTIAVTGDVYRLAAPITNTGSITMAARVNDPQPMGTISVTNMAPDSYTESLRSITTVLPLGFNTVGGSPILQPGQTGAAATIVMSTAAAGTFGGKAEVSYLSTAVQGTFGAPADVEVGKASIPISGKVYQTAKAGLSTNALNFGIVHVGDKTPVLDLGITNTAISPLTDKLHGGIGLTPASWLAFTKGLDLPTAGLAGGATHTASFGLNTDKAGVFKGAMATTAFSSRNPDMPDVTLKTEFVTLEGQVNNHAVLKLLNPNRGVLQQTEGGFTLNFGTVNHGGVLNMAMDILNDAAAPADDLSISGLSLVNGGSIVPFWSVSANNLAAGAVSSQGLRFTLGALPLGAYSVSYLLNAFESNASLYTGALVSGPLTITIQGVVAAPEPWSMSVMIGGAAIILNVRRRRRNGA